MNSSEIPSRISKAFGVNGDKNTIPVDSTTTTLNSGTATFDSGFPPVTMQPLSAGGIPPAGKDMNGVLYSVSLQQQWQDAGMGFPFNADFSTAISGYPKGAVLPASTLTGQWLNLNESNTTSPESSVGASTGWVPVGNYGNTFISGLSSTSITMSSSQASKDRIILSGTLTSNIALFFPPWLKAWTIVNNCAGNFGVVCRTVSGTGINVLAGTVEKIIGDGTNLNRDFGSAAMRNVGNSSSQIPDMSFFSGGDRWFKLPNGAILQWGTGSTASGATNVNIVFPTAFSTSTPSVVVTDTGQSTKSYGVTAVSSSGATIYTSNNTGTSGFRYIAIGY